jgi:hypothetical protein
MEKNFRVDQSNALARDNELFDLHNCYDYKGIILQGSRALYMFFEPNAEYGLGQAPIMLKFSDISYFEISSNFGGVEVSVLEEIGYKAAGDRDDNWLLDEQQASQNSDLFFRFAAGHFIRVNSRVAILQIGKMPSF